MSQLHILIPIRQPIVWGHMSYIKHLLISLTVLFSLLIWTSTDSFATTKYAASTVQGTGDCSSAANAGLIANCWSVIAAGDTLELADGTYTGASSNIDPPDTLAGTSTNRITVKATNDGQVTIDGQFARPALSLGAGNTYFTIEGINAHSGEGITVYLSGPNAILKRIVAWDAANTTTAEMVARSTRGPCLVEDSAFFGRGRKMLTFAQGGDGCTARRVWGMWMADTQHVSMPNNTLEIGYNSTNITFENTIATWNTLAGEGPQSPIGTLDVFYGDSDPSRITNSKILGSIQYALNGYTFSPPRHIAATRMGEFEFKHNVAYFGSNFTTKYAYYLLNPGMGGVATNLRIVDSVAVGPRSPLNLFESDWTVTNLRQGTTVANAIAPATSIFDVVPGICYQYIDRTLTNRPLWPWPMDQRIKDARIAAGNAPISSDGTVTKVIEDMFGPIPSQCKTTGGGGTTVSPNPPTNLRVF